MHTWHQRVVSFPESRHVPYLAYRWLLHPVSFDISLCYAVRWLRFLIKKFTSMAAFIKQISTQGGKKREQKEEGTRSGFHQTLKCSTNLFRTLWSFNFPLKCGLNKVAKKHMLLCQTFHLFGWLKAAWEGSLPLPEEMEHGGLGFILEPFP